MEMAIAASTARIAGSIWLRGRHSGLRSATMNQIATHQAGEQDGGKLQVGDVEARPGPPEEHEVDG